MLEQIAWLHLSDLHFRTGQSEWGQNVTARDLLADIRRRLHEWPSISFAIVTGDLAFSGDRDEYRLVEAFLTDLLAALQMAPDRLFAVPGNHDVDRQVQKTCYAGARAVLVRAPAVDDFLGDPAEVRALLRRQRHYRNFARRFGQGDGREITQDGLGYVSTLDLDGLKISIAGLNSAWLCGADDDANRILVGERQVLGVLKILETRGHLLTIGLLHHPPAWLCDFDQGPLLDRFVRECGFVHRGHLHEPSVSLVQFLSGETCVMVGAGPMYVGRHFANTYSLTILNIAEGNAVVRTYAYAGGHFHEEPQQPVSFRLRGPLPGTCAQGAAGIAQLVPKCIAPEYLAAVLWEKKTELPIPFPGGNIIFAAPHLLGEAEPSYGVLARDFLQARNLMRAHPDLRSALDHCRGRIQAYSDALANLAHSSAAFAATLREQNSQAVALCVRDRPGATVPSYNAVDLLDRLERERAYDDLELTSRRYVNSDDAPVATHARRMLGRCLVRSSHPDTIVEGAQLLAAIARSPAGTPGDLLVAIAGFESGGASVHAKELLLFGLRQFPAATADLKRIGHRFAMNTGDGDLRAIIDKHGTDTEANIP